MRQALTNNLKIWLINGKLRWGVVLQIFVFARFIPGADRIFQSLLYAKVLLTRHKIVEQASALSPDLQVMSGPFAGMRYPSGDAAGSMLAPKLLGTYESELAPVFNPEYLRKFDCLLDVGCAEGYYAVGSCLMAPGLEVVAFDTDPLARQLSRAMAEFNGVEGRVDFRDGCSPGDFQRFAEQRILVLSDCEGYEMNLFSAEAIGFLQRADLVIEVHEHLGADLAELIQRLEPSHRLRIVPSVTDLEKVSQYELLQDSIPHSVRALLLAECRPRRMKWLIASARKCESDRNSLH